jgi:hypothetical protein
LIGARAGGSRDSGDSHPKDLTGEAENGEIDLITHFLSSSCLIFGVTVADIFVFEEIDLSHMHRRGTA